MPSRVLETDTRVDEASVSLRPDNPRRWTSVELGHQQNLATTRKRVSATPQTTVPLASLVNHSPSTPTPVSSETQSRNLNGSTTEASPDAPSGSRNRRVRPSSTSRPSSVPLQSGVGSYFLPQPGASGIEARSPANKRAPASRSSHGIETSNGPPPALSTQRSYSSEDPWRYPAPVDQLALRPRLTHRALQGLAADTTAWTNSSNSTIRPPDLSFDKATEPTPSENTSNTQRDIPTYLSDMSATTPRLNDHYPSEPDQDRTIRVSESTAVATGEEGKGIQEGGEVRLSQEDLFLDLAHTDISIQDLTDASGRIERRRVSKRPERTGDPCYAQHFPPGTFVSGTPSLRVCTPRETRCKLWSCGVMSFRDYFFTLSSHFCQASIFTAPQSLVCLKALDIGVGWANSTVSCSLVRLSPFSVSHRHMLIKLRPLRLHGSHLVAELLPAKRVP